MLKYGFSSLHHSAREFQAYNVLTLILYYTECEQFTAAIKTRA